jgi:hypothetical protein
MNTADEFMPDGLEYQTGKLWQGKAVYRKCIQGTSPASQTETATDVYLPTTGTILYVGGIVDRTDNKKMTIDSYSLQLLVWKTTGRLYLLPMNALYCNTHYVAWVEYTKS